MKPVEWATAWQTRVRDEQMDPHIRFAVADGLAEFKRRFGLEDARGTCDLWLEWRNAETEFRLHFRYPAVGRRAAGRQP